MKLTPGLPTLLLQTLYVLKADIFTLLYTTVKRVKAGTGYVGVVDYTVTFQI